MNECTAEFDSSEASSAALAPKLASLSRENISTADEGFDSSLPSTSRSVESRDEVMSSLDVATLMICGLISNDILQFIFSIYFWSTRPLVSSTASYASV